MLKATVGVFLAIWCIVRGLSGAKPKRVFYVTIPILSLAYLVWKTMYVVVMLILEIAPDNLGSFFVLSIILVPFSFVCIWMMSVALFLYHRRAKNKITSAITHCT